MISPLHGKTIRRIITKMMKTNGMPSLLLRITVQEPSLVSEADM
jgi:uncharacterized protein (DUF2132 family)